MPYVKRPSTPEEYVQLVESALVELDELRASFEFDMEEMATVPVFIEHLERELRALRQSMADGSYHFENKDLPFMELVNRNLRHIPFSELLATINKTHREGLEIEQP